MPCLSSQLNFSFSLGCRGFPTACHYVVFGRTSERNQSWFPDFSFFQSIFVSMVGQCSIVFRCSMTWY
jgi:hypothetical protein